LHIILKKAQFKPKIYLKMNIKNQSLLINKCYVNGSWVSLEKKIKIINPATGKLLAEVPNFGKKETSDAINAAELAFRSWSKLTAHERSKVLKKWYELVIENQDDLAIIMTSEQGKPLSEAKGEIVYAANFIEWFAEEAKRVYGDVLPDPIKDKRMITLKQPIGVCAAITRKCAPGLAAGCTFVIKPAEQTPLTAIAFVVLAEQAGFPKGVINIITGDPEEIGKEITSNPKVRKISFTGSTAVGRILMEQSASTVKKLSLELGGNAPFIVFDDCDLDAAVEGLMLGKFRNTGQVCVSPNRIYVQEKIYDVFVKKVVEVVKKLKMGDGLKGDTQVGPLIDDAAIAKVEEHIKDAVQKGAQIKLGGKRHVLGGRFYEPTVLADVNKSMKLANEETFGPVAPFFKFKTEEEVIDFANNTEFGLAAYFFSKDIARIWRVAEAIEVGMVGINTGIFASAYMPFGGIKQSGIGREGAKYGMEEYLELKTLSFGNIK
jgi:succinate-semialdehyde dehydrogenase/glutarate-semialdehyde dehydrogenase